MAELGEVKDDKKQKRRYIQYKVIYLLHRVVVMDSLFEGCICFGPADQYWIMLLLLAIRRLPCMWALHVA